jgi:multidrug efflux pump subunit AcrB
VDEGVVEIENIDSTLYENPGITTARGVLQATQRTVAARFLSMLAIVAVFVPSLLMTGVAKNLFAPLSLAVAFAMVASFLLSSSLLPVLFLWIHGKRAESSHGLNSGKPIFDRVRERWGRILEGLSPFRWPVVAAYVVVAGVILAALGPRVGRELFPNVTGRQFRLRFDAPTGTRAEETANLVTNVLEEIKTTAGAGNVDISLGYLGTQGASYPINTVFLWTSGPQEAVMNVALRPGANLDVAALEEKLRGILPPKFPGCSFSFEPGDIVSQIMNFGAPTPVELAVMGPDFAAIRGYTEKLRGKLSQVPALRDLKFEQALDYPSVDVHLNRELAGQLGVTAEQVARSLSEATASSRFTTPNYWADPKTGVAYQVQVQYPQPKMTSVQDVQNIPVMPGDNAHPLIGDLARVTEGTLVGEYDRINGLWLLSLSANLAGEDLGQVASRIDAAIHAAGELPRGATVQVRGQIAPMRTTFTNLGFGLLLAVAVIFLLLAANFESLRLSFVIFTTAPATLCGVIVALLVTHTTLNIQSYMGAIMALGVGTANAILLVTFADERRRAGGSALAAGIEGARTRMRPIVMTSAAMIAGMIPMALALGEGAEAAAPLGRAVIGGLVAATLANLTVLPYVFSLVQAGAGTVSASLDPDDPQSRFAG